MMTFKSPYADETVTVYLNRKNYRSGNTCLTLVDAVDHFPYMTCTVFVDGLEDNEVAIKNYSENAGVLDFLVKENIIEAPHKEINSGFVKLYVCKLKK